MSIPFVIDNQGHRLWDALNELLAQSVGKPKRMRRPRNDRILHRMAGLTEDEARCLEERLAKML